MTLLDLIDATWPAARKAQAGGFTLRLTEGAGSRVAAATLAVPFEAADPEAAIAAMQAAGQRALFLVGPGQEALDRALAARGLQIEDETVSYRAPLNDLAAEVPPVTAFAHWAPLQITREIWSETGIGAARQAIMARVEAPKTCILGRIDDRAAGAAFVAIADDTAMLHALSVLPEKRRKGLARAMLHEAVRWALEAGAKRLTLVVRADNTAACALYESLGMVRGPGYHYRAEPRT
jgi:ribosomal protein S18 acetylase RimI-like enzyme